MRMMLLLAVLAIAGCHPTAADPARPAVQADGAVRIADRADALHFAYAWPPEAAAIPALDRRFRGEAAKARDDALANARADQELAKRAGREFHPHELARTWTAAGQSKRLLSLASAADFFTGGAHPNHAVDSLLWDRSLGREIGVADLFDPPTRFAELISFPYCQALDVERHRRRAGAQLDGEFAACPNLSALAIVPTDSDGNGRFEAIRLVAAPYVAGPYVEGEYAVPVAVSGALIAAMKPDYRASFEPQRQ
jgi:hypothetical protein